jgi:hypothetical protein
MRRTTIAGDKIIRQPRGIRGTTTSHEVEGLY